VRVENAGRREVNRNTDMSDGSAAYSVSLRTKINDLEMDCINLGGVNDLLLDYKKISRK